MALRKTAQQIMAASHIRVRVGTADQAIDIKNVTNEAFMADSFFKKVEYHQRFTDEDVHTLMSASNAVFLVASESVSASASSDDVEEAEDTALPQEVLGSLYLCWKYDHDHLPITGTDVVSGERGVSVVGKFSAVSVPTRFGKRGIGKTLVRAAEAYLLAQALAVAQAKALTASSSSSSSSYSSASPSSSTERDTQPSQLCSSLEAPKPSPLLLPLRVWMEMGVINQREDLFPWYQTQGYSCVHRLPRDLELQRIVSDGLDVHCILMRKDLSPESPPTPLCL